MIITQDSIHHVDMLERCYKVTTPAGILEIDIPDEIYTALLERLAKHAGEQLQKLSLMYYKFADPQMPI